MPFLHADAPIGRLMSRREALSVLGAAGASLFFESFRAQAQSRPACVAVPQQTEGPYFVDTRLARSDIRSDSTSGTPRAGVPLALAFIVSRLDAKGCTPLPGAHVELWQCDAQGLYSGVRDRSFDTTGQNFLRGYQVTDAEGTARFTTIYPGWYPGRTVHLHFMILTGREGARRTAFASQLYFDDALSDRILARAPYRERGTRTSRNEEDGIFRRGGAQLLLDVKERAGALSASFPIGLKDVPSAL